MVRPKTRPKKMSAQSDRKKDIRYHNITRFAHTNGRIKMEDKK